MQTATRCSGEITLNKHRLFSENESADLCRCVDFAKGNCETLTYEQERQLDKLQEKLTDGYPSLEAEPPSCLERTDCKP